MAEDRGSRMEDRGSRMEDRGRIYRWLAFAVLMLTAVPVRGQVVGSQEAYNSSFEERSGELVERLLGEAVRKAELRRQLRSAGDTRPANVMTTPQDRLDLLEAALLIKSGRDVEMGNTAIREEADQPFRGGMFYIHDVMAAYLHAYDGLKQETRDAVRRSLKRWPIYRGDTENHWVLYYTGLYLASQTWPDDPDTTWFNGKSASENKAEARDFLEHWMRLTTTIGQGEFDSPTYIIVFLSPMYTLYTFCEDPVLKEKARKMLDWLLADYAAEYLKGLYVGGHSRDYTYDAVEPRRAPSVGWGWLVFGDTDPVYRSDNLLAAWSEYRLPVVIHNVAVDRSTSYTHLERKRTRNIIRYGEEMNPPVYKTTYMAPTYALGSLHGGVLQPIQQHTWDVTYVDDTTNTTIFTVHPYYSAFELAMFFPEEIEWLSDEVDRYHLVYTNPDKWNSSSPYERTFQHENAIIVLYDLAPGVRHPHVDGFFPKSLDRREVDASGWIFSQGGDSYVAVRPLKPYEWIEEDAGWRLRSHELRNGFVVEVAMASEYTSFDDFKEQIRSNPLDLTRFTSTNRVSYTTSRGDVLDFRYPDARVLNGEPVDLSAMPLFQGPYVNGDGESQRLVITHGGMEHVVDFGD